MKLKLFCSAALLLAATLAVNPIVAQAQTEKKLPIRAGTSIQKGEKYVSDSGNHYLALEADGNLIVRQTDGKYVWGINAVVGKDFQFAQVARVEFKADTSFALINGTGQQFATTYLPKQNPAGGPKDNPVLILSAVGSLQAMSGGKVVLASSDGNFGPDLPISEAIKTAGIAQMLVKNDTDLASQPGWGQCYEMKGYGINIFATKTVSYNAIKSVALIYALMLDLLQPTLCPEMNPKLKFEGFNVFITNQETGQALKRLSTVKDVHQDGDGEGSRSYILGGANADFVWITEQMICKKGIVTRNMLPGAKEDKSYRSFDQVVHEFAHSIDLKFDLQKQGASTVFIGPIGPLEGFAIAVQSWFGVQFPCSSLSDNQRAFMGRIFKQQMTFSPAGYPK